MTRAFRRLFCRALIGVMLFAQLAIAAYACPDLSSSARRVQPASGVAARNGSAVSGEDMSAMSAGLAGDRLMNCDQMPGPLDPASPNLCAEHCRYGQQSDQTTTPTAPAGVLTSLYTVPTVPELLAPTRPSAASDSVLAAASPPLAILHCRFRD